MIRLPSRAARATSGASRSRRATGAVAVEEIDPTLPRARQERAPDHVFRLSPLRPGEAMLRFEQRRPWENGAAERDTRTIQVVVEA